MTVMYLEFIGIIILWILSYFVKNIKIEKVFHFLIIASLLFFSCVRSFDTGADTRMYVNMFNMIKQQSWSSLLRNGFRHHEKGYVLLNKLIATIYDNERFFIVVTSFLAILPTCIFIQKKSENCYLGYMLYVAMEFWFNEMYVIRQSIAISFCLISLIFINKKGFKNFLYFLFFVLLASSFHQTAIIFVITYFLRFIKINCKSFLVGMTIVIIFLIGGKQIVTFLNQFARIKYEIGFTGGFMMWLCLWAMAIFIYIAYNGEFNEHPDRKILYLMIVCSVIVQTLSLNIELLIRLARYFMMAIFAIFPSAYKRFIARDGSLGIQIVANCIIIVLAFILLLLWIDRPYVTGYYFM